MLAVAPSKRGGAEARGSVTAMTRYQRFVCRFMRFVGGWGLVLSGLLTVGLLIGVIKGTVSWYSIPVALLCMALSAGTRWLASFIERELSDWAGH